MAPSAKKKTVAKTGKSSQKKVVTTSKKSPASAKKASAKKSTTLAQKSAIKSSPTKKAPAKKATSVATTTKKSPATSPKSTTKKVAPKKKVVSKKIVSTPVKSFEKENISKNTVAPKNKKSHPVFGMKKSIFLAAVGGIAILSGFMYSRSFFPEFSSPSDVKDEAVLTEPSAQRINVLSSVTITPEIISALENIALKITLHSDEVLVKAQTIYDVVSAQNQLPYFSADLAQNDFVFDFTSFSLLYRPSTGEIVRLHQNT